MQYTLAHLEELVVRRHGAGVTGMLVGPAATREERQEFTAGCIQPGQLHRSADRRWLYPHARRTLNRELHRGPIDLRPYVLSARMSSLFPADCEGRAA